MAEPELTSPAEEQLIYVPGVADMYADAFQMQASAYTISLHYSMQVGQNVIKPQVTVRMSPAHAKMMCIIMKRQLQQYETQFGNIELPSVLVSEKDINLAKEWDAV